MLPEIVQEFLLKNKEREGCFCLALDDEQKIVQFFGNPELLNIKVPVFNDTIYQYIPGVLTETFDSDFEIPFYNISSTHVCNIYFLKFPAISYIILVDKSEIFQITQKYQQFAHEDNISKNKFKRLAQQLEKTQKELTHANQEKATLIAMLSHELGTPLTSILGYCELLEKKEIASEKGLKTIYRNAHYLKNMIENTLLFGRSEATDVSIEHEEIKLNELFANLKSTLLPSARNKNLALNFETADLASTVIYIDATRTKQILINLLNNAVKYTESGSITLSFSQTQGNYIFSVADTGLGVPRAMQESIFNPWKRLNANNEKGAGIGLFISQKIAQVLNGKIKLKHSSTKKGSVFQLILPVGNKPPAKAEVEPQIEEKDLSKTLLIIDDDEDILELIAMILADSHLNIQTALDFEVAQMILAKHKVHIILTDYNLGAVKASDFIAELKAEHNIPVLLMSAIPTTNLIKKYKKQGFDDVIIKPLDSKNLLTNIYKNLNNFE